MSSLSNQRLSNSSMIVEIIGIMIVMLFGVFFVWILSTTIISFEKTQNVYVLPLITSMVFSLLLGATFLDLEDWNDIEKILHYIEMIGLVALASTMFLSMSLKNPELTLTILSVILGVILGLILVVGIRFFLYIYNKKLEKKQTKRNNSQIHVKHGSQEEVQNESDKRSNQEIS